MNNYICKITDKKQHHILAANDTRRTVRCEPNPEYTTILNLSDLEKIDSQPLCKSITSYLSL